MQPTVFHMLILVEADLGEHGTEIATLSLLAPFYIWPPSPFPLRSSTHHFIFCLESLIYFVCVYVCERVCAGACEHECVMYIHMVK